MGLNKPLGEQYLDFVVGVIHLDFGISMARPVPVIDEIKTFLPATIELALFSMLVITLVGVTSGAYAAQHRKSASDYIIRILGIILYSIPIFWLGLMFQMFFGAKLGWLPVSGRLSPGMTPDYHITRPIHSRCPHQRGLAAADRCTPTSGAALPHFGADHCRGLHPPDQSQHAGCTRI